MRGPRRVSATANSGTNIDSLQSWIPKVMSSLHIASSERAGAAMGARRDTLLQSAGNPFQAERPKKKKRGAIIVAASVLQRWHSRPESPLREPRRTDRVERLNLKMIERVSQADHVVQPHLSLVTYGVSRRCSSLRTFRIGPQPNVKICISILVHVMGLLSSGNNPRRSLHGQSHGGELQRLGKKIMRGKNIVMHRINYWSRVPQ
nr:hypothetical protein Iba_chr10eCG7700 [Ipomoea batatas]